MMLYKVRAWGPWGDWIEDESDYNDPRCAEFERQYAMIYGDELAFEEYLPLNDLLNQNHFDLMLWTGLTDANGQEIYKGDMPDGIYSECYIGWCDQYATFALQAYGYCFQCARDILWDEFVKSVNDGEVNIIGHIYEHPELRERIAG